jgi:CPA1 family monovalent cation:H+ antiporter
MMPLRSCCTVLPSRLCGGELGAVETLLQFVFAAVVGVALGIAVSMAARWALCATEDSFTQTAITLLAPYVAWVLGELTQASAVLACVVGGLHLRQHFSAAVAPTTRLQARAVWNLLIFVLNGFIFILIGLQLGALREAVLSGRFGLLLIVGALVSVTAIVVRLGWCSWRRCFPGC